MKQQIYTSQFKTGPETTKKQQMLFAADTAYALSEGYEFIKGSDEATFKILDANTLVEVVFEELLEEPTEAEFDPTENAEEDDGYCIACNNLELIDSIINNTLSQKDDIRSEQADTMLKLARLKQMFTE